MNCYRVSHYVKGQQTITYVCAESDREAADFLGVRDGSASVSKLAGPVIIAKSSPDQPAAVGTNPTKGVKHV